jgi:trehalose/maltose transport system substrate-binding protein
MADWSIPIAWHGSDGLILFESLSLSRGRCFAGVFLLANLVGCGQRSQSASQVETITALMWTAGGRGTIDQQLIEEFTTRTGISVRLVPASESSSQRLGQELTLLKERSTAVDIYQIDTSWIVRLAPYLMDLRQELAASAPDELPDVIDTATFNGRLVGAPFLVGYGLLYYRKDLLLKYGFDGPPKTWEELESQAKRIQKGERRAGHPDFWGYVWQGADYEGLTCNALEWQYSDGGGNFVVGDRQANTMNAAAVQAFARAAGWLGAISPPGTVAYVEEDSRNLWQSGNAMFMRNWGYAYPLAKQSAEMRNRFAVAPLPSGRAEQSSVLGGWYLGIAATSVHGKAAAALVKFLTSKPAQERRALTGSLFPTLRSVYADSRVVRTNEIFSSISSIAQRSIRRPTSAAGAAYFCASRVYAHGVHEILQGKPAADGAAAMNARLQAVLNAPAEASQDCQ